MQKTSEGTEGIPEKRKPRSLSIAAKGIRTGDQFASLMSSLMTDVISGEVAPVVANAAVNAGGKLLKIIELQIKYGTTKDDGQKVLNLYGRESENGGQSNGPSKDDILKKYILMREKLDEQEKSDLEKLSKVRE